MNGDVLAQLSLEYLILLVVFNCIIIRQLKYSAIKNPITSLKVEPRPWLNSL